MAALRDYAGPSARKFSELARAYGAKFDVDEFLKSEGEKVESSLSRTEVLRAQIANMQRELTELERFPEDNFEVGTIVAFDRKFKGNDQVFSYAAIKGTETQWYLSGLIANLVTTPVGRERERRVTWDQLTYAMRNAMNVRVIFKTDGHLLTDEPRVDYVAEAQLHWSPEVAQSVDKFLANPTTGVRRERSQHVMWDVGSRQRHLGDESAPKLGEQPNTEPPVLSPVRDPSGD